MSGYDGYHPKNYGSKAPIIPDTAASQIALKKISMYRLDKLVEELTQNLANVRFLFSLFSIYRNFTNFIPFLLLDHLYKA